MVSNRRIISPRDHAYAEKEQQPVGPPTQGRRRLGRLHGAVEEEQIDQPAQVWGDKEEGQEEQGGDIEFRRQVVAERQRDPHAEIRGADQGSQEGRPGEEQQNAAEQGRQPGERLEDE